jgi:Family of unknown function (DUF5686)/CarboxypepD_reg-like domain
MYLYRSFVKLFHSMTIRLTPFLFLQIFWLFNAHAQVQGVVTEAGGEPLPFATVYVQGTTVGTTTNLQGDYFLELEKGSYQLIFQYVGFRHHLEKVTVRGRPVQLDVVLEKESIQLQEIEVKANAEDPAYPIIRKAIAKRKYYLEQVGEYTCDVYIKGNVKLLDAPEKIFGQDVGDLEGSLDTNRQGIVYLSESVSKLYFRQPDKFKEVMVSSKVSGNNQGFSFNSAQDMNINFYENLTQFGRKVISPIAEGALGHYRYKLHGAVVDEEGRLIHKIEVIPKRPEEPVYQGFIYIVNDLWNIQSTDLFVTGQSIQQPLFDTFYIRQTHVPVAAPDVWRLFSQTFSLRGGIFGFKFGGSFTAIYRNYDLSPNLASDFFGPVIMKVEEGANEKDTAYWNDTRPVPLTQEEGLDYQKKDSIQVVHASKEYLDSMDRVNNKFKWTSLLFGYSHENSWRRRAFTFEAPLNTVQFNTVQGYNMYAGLGYRKNFDKNRVKWMEVKSKLSYGFGEDVFRAGGEFTYNFDRKTFSRLSLSGGREIAQFNEEKPISRFNNTLYTTFFRRNYIRLFDKTYLRLKYRREIANGLLLHTFVQWAKRSPLDVHSDYSFFYRDSRTYDLNVPENSAVDAAVLAESKALTAGFDLRIRPGQKYFDYPDRKYIMGSKWPDLWLHYRQGIAFGGGSGNGLRSDVRFQRLAVAVTKENLSLGLAGNTSFYLEAGSFMGRKTLYFQDFKHFMGNETNLGNPAKYLTSFKALPYYRQSSTASWAEGHWEHNFQGFLLDKTPLFKKLGWTTIAGAGFLYTQENKDYWEVSLGLGNLGFGIFRLLRFDVVSSFQRGKYAGTSYLIGLNIGGGGEISF